MKIQHAGSGKDRAEHWKGLSEAIFLGRARRSLSSSAKKEERSHSQQNTSLWVVHRIKLGVSTICVRNYTSRSYITYDMIRVLCYTPQTWGCLSANKDSEWINKRKISSLKRCQLLGQFQQRWELHGTTTKLHASGAKVQDWDIWDNLQCAYVCIVCSVH